MTCNNAHTTIGRRLPLCLLAVSALLPGLAAAEDMPIAAHQTDLVVDAALSLPSDVAVGGDGRIYVVSGGSHEVAVFDANGERLATLGGQGSEPGQFFEPVGIGIGPGGEIYVADKGNQRLQVFSGDGRFERQIPLVEEDEAVDPVDVAVSANGRELFVTANNSHRLLVFSESGRFLRGWGGEGEDDGQFRYPATVVLDPQGRVMVVDVLNQRVQKFDSEGALLGSFGGLGGKAGTFFRPKGIAVDAQGNAYVSDSFLGAIQVFAADGSFLYAVGEGGETTAFDTPVGMTFHDSRLFVVQMLAGNVLVLDIEARPGMETKP